MALILADRVKETTNTTGTGTLSLVGAVAGFQSFVAGVGTTNTTYYAITDSATGAFEVGIGTVTAGSPDTLSRDTVLESSNSDNLVNFSAGQKIVICTQPAEKAVYLDASDQLVIDGTSVTATAVELNHVDGVTSAIQTQLNAKLESSSYTASDVLTKIKTVDGTGSGLDADLLDGNEATAFATSAQGSLADSALQPSDNISELTNNSGYITGNQTITLSGDVSGSGTTSIAVTLTKDPVITLSGAVTGSATMTNLGNVTISTTATSDPTITLAGDLTGSVTLTNLTSGTLTATVVDDSHDHIISNVDGLQSALDGKQATISGGATTITGANLTASRALVSDASGKVAVSAVTSTELGHLDGVTSAIQTQLNTKAPINNATFTGTTTIPTADINGGTIDGVTIGGASAGAGTFTTLNTTGSVVFNNAGANVDFRVEGDTDANLLFVDASADAIGIGTSSPGAKLDVLSTTRLRGGVSAGNSLHTVTFHNTNNGAWNIAQIEALAGSQVWAGDLAFKTTAPGFANTLVERMRITSAGNVGIGTSSPNEIFTVSKAGAAGTTAVLANFGNETNAGNTKAAIRLSNNTITDVCSVQLIADRIGANAGADFVIECSNPVPGTLTERFRITEAGNVGIGTTSPGAKLSVDGSAIFNESGADVDFRVESDTNTHALFVNAGNSRVGINNSSPASALDVNGDVTITDKIIHSGDTNTAIRFPAADTVTVETAGTERMRITSTGNVGIGTSSPVAFSTLRTVDLRGTDGVGIRFGTSSGVTGFISGGPTTIRFGTGNAIPILLETNGAERMRITSSGNVGIGTTSPQGPLDVAASGATVNQFLTGGVGNNAVTGVFRIGSGIGRGASIQGFRGGSSNVHSLDFYTYNSTDVFAMRIDSSGNLGLGVVPSAYGSGSYKALQIGGSTNIMGRAGGSDAYFMSNTYFDQTDYKYVASLAAARYTQSGGEHQWYNAASGTANNTITFTQAMTLDASGNLGLGTTSISADTRLAVVGPRVGNSLDNATQLLMNTATTVSDRLNINFSMNGVANRARAGIGAVALDSSGGYNCGLAFYTRNAPDGSSLATTDERMRIDGAGNVGIGTTSPASKLDVSGDVTITNKIIHSGDTNTYIQFHAADQWRVVTGDGERLEVNNTNTTVQNNLIVNGSATFNGAVSGITVSPTAVSDQNNTSTGYFDLPSGTTAQRPASPAFGMIRTNTTTGEPEWYSTEYSRWVPFRQPANQYDIEYVVVAGGGGGGGGEGSNGFGGAGAGGGAGGYVEATSSVSPGESFTILIGAGGGTGGQGFPSGASSGGNGGDSSGFGSLAIGGGGGSGEENFAPGSGGSGGGQGGDSPGVAGDGTTGQGNNGGVRDGRSGGGGGGASQVGSTNGASRGGDGTTWLDGVTYAGGGGGGGGGGRTGNVAGGTGGGGQGGASAGNSASNQGYGGEASGTANTGGGGGGKAAGRSNDGRGAGGSGVVIVRYEGAQRGSGGTVTSVGGYTYHTFTSSGAWVG